MDTRGVCLFGKLSAMGLKCLVLSTVDSKQNNYVIVSIRCPTMTYHNKQHTSCLIPSQGDSKLSTVDMKQNKHE